MKSVSKVVLGGFVFLGVLFWSSRSFWRETVEAARKPTLPTAAVYRGDYEATVASTTTVTGTRLPKAVNLAIPFLSQAPKQNWNMPYQEACEEASMIMVHAYFNGRTKIFGPEEGDQAILDLIHAETKKGLDADMTARQASDLIPGYFTAREARIVSHPTVEMIKKLLASGIPVIVPADGKALKNPNFRNGGPPYHMVVIKGYLADGRWIVNDPGTRKGADYLYDREVLFSAIHDWNGGDVSHGTPVMIVMQAKKT